MKPTLLILSIFVSYFSIDLVTAVAPLSNGAATLPFNTLPNNHCSVPAVCGQVNGAKIQCRCDETITVCYNDQHQYCWGSSTLHQTTGCPSMPNACSSRFNSTVSCLCNSSNVLCVDQYSHACYGSYRQGTSNVTLLPLGGLPPPPSSASSAVSSVIPSTSSVSPSSSSSIVTQSKGTMAATSTPTPNHSAALSPFLCLPLLVVVTFAII
ncbi:hypothetical protein BCR42DRAFT_401857 [Absidia repens]|uniref:Extracellular membrane protein CFEM domain-containing protein n=1 Tax=Absidia repens TaxID=90262 RepID=A0A1X2J328_9FUNG|nr:hypothetical protein BCR42DRAFT_401857 [Absidia repens]